MSCYIIWQYKNNNLYIYINKRDSSSNLELTSLKLSYNDIIFNFVYNCVYTLSNPTYIDERSNSSKVNNSL